MLVGICTATFPTPSMPCLGALVDMTDTCHSGTWPRPRACVCAAITIISEDLILLITKLTIQCLSRYCTVDIVTLNNPQGCSQISASVTIRDTPIYACQVDRMREYIAIHWVDAASVSTGQQSPARNGQGVHKQTPFLWLISITRCSD